MSLLPKDFNYSVPVLEDFVRISHRLVRKTIIYIESIGVQYSNFRLPIWQVQFFTKNLFKNTFVIILYTN